jgi:RNA polymerase sigma-70 factor (ECF subfamily)
VNPAAPGADVGDTQAGSASDHGRRPTAGHGRQPLSASEGVADEALVLWAREGHQEAFEELVRRHRDRAYRVALRLLGDPHLAEDVAQEALVAAWRALPRFRREARFSTWLYRIVTNTALNYSTRRREVATEVVELPETGQGAPADLVAEHNREVARIEAVIAQLPLEQRAALVLRSFEQCTYEEVAEILGITVPAVKGRLHRARRELTERLREGP